jgi:nitroreductase
MVFDLIPRARTVRKFKENQPVDLETLRSLVNLARLSPSAANLQTLKYLLANTPERNRLIFGNLAWAGYLKDWPGPGAGERPAAYILQLGDEQMGSPREVDAGLALQSMILGAASRGLGTCVLGSVNRPELQQALQLPSRYSILYALALGRPGEEVQLETVGPDGDIRYWRDETGVLHVPKRSLDELIVDIP